MRLWILAMALGHMASAWAQTFCEMKTDYTPGVTCASSYVVVDDQTELDAYLIDFGFNGTKYQNLRINFNVSGDDLQIHSPCQIQVAQSTTFDSNILCLDGRWGVDVGSLVNASSTEMAFLSENDIVHLGSQAELNASTLILEGFKLVDIGTEAEVTISGSMSMTSSGSLSSSGVTIAQDSEVHAQSLSMTSPKSVQLGVTTEINIANNFSMISSGTSTNSEVLIKQSADVQAGSIYLSADRQVQVGISANVSATGTLSLISTGSSSGSAVDINQGAAIAGNNVNISAQNRAKLGITSTVNATHHFNMQAYNCQLSLGYSVTAQTKTGNCFGNPNSAPAMLADQQFTGTRTLPIPLTLSGATDSNGDYITYTLVSAPASGELTNCLGGTPDLTCTYTPDPMENDGSVTFTYRASDGIVNSGQVATVTVQLNAYPVMVGSLELIGTEDQLLSFNLNGAVDSDGDELTYHVVSGPASGTLQNCLGDTDDLSCEFVPATNFNGQVSFTYRANDGFDNAVSSSTVTITFNPVNDAPAMLGNQNLNATEDVTYSFNLLGATDADGDTIRYTILTLPASGTLINCLNGDSDLSCDYIPAKNFNGIVTFTYKANDGTLDSAQVSTVSITVGSANDAPVLPAQDLVIIQQNQTRNFNLAEALDSDTSTSTLSYELGDSPAKGALSNCLGLSTDLSCSFAPDTDEYGADQFSYIAYDESSSSTPRVVKLFINRPPVAELTASTVSGVAPLTVEFTGVSSTDVDGTVTSYAWNFDDGESASGTNSTHVFETPGSYDVSLTVIDNYGGQHNVQETITVTAFNAPPVPVIHTSSSIVAPSSTVAFNASSSTDDGSIVSYDWDFGDTNTDSGASVTHAYSSEGVYEVVLTVTDNLSVSRETSVFINVKNAPCLGASGSTHANGGGFVASSTDVDSSAYVGPLAQVCGNAQVLDQVRIDGRVVVSEDAVIKENATVTGPPASATGTLTIYDSAIIQGESLIQDTAQVYGNAKVSGKSLVAGEAQVYGDAQLENAEVNQTAKVYGQAFVQGSGEVTSDDVNPEQPNDAGLVSKSKKKSLKETILRSRVLNSAEVYDEAQVLSNAWIFNAAKIFNFATVSNSKVEGSAEVKEYAQVKANEQGQGAYVGGSAEISGQALVQAAQVFGSAQILDMAQIISTGEYPAKVFDQAIVKQYAIITNSQVFEDAQVFGSAQIINNSLIHGTAEVDYDVDGQDIDN